MATLAELMTRWRDDLDDEVDGPYLWSNERLTALCNRIVKILCDEADLIQDIITPSICEITTVVGQATYSVSDLITRIYRAKLSTQTKRLGIMDHISDLDGRYSDWENAGNGDPMLLVEDGVGTNKILLYPPPDTVETLSLSVYRHPLVPLDWDTDQDNSPEIPEKYHDEIDDGVYWLAYKKHDADTEDKQKSADHHTAFLAGIERVKRGQVKERRRNRSAVPPRGSL